MGDVVPAANYTIRWNAQPGGSPIARFDVFSAADDQVQWQAIAECTALPASARQCVWQHPAPPTNRGRIRVQATDQADRPGNGFSGRIHHSRPVRR